MDVPLRGSRRPQLLDRARELPKVVRDFARKAQVRLYARYRRLIGSGKRATVATTAVAREMAAFLWAITRQVTPVAAA